MGGELERVRLLDDRDDDGCGCGVFSVSTCFVVETVDIPDDDDVDDDKTDTRCCCCCCCCNDGFTICASC